MTTWREGSHFGDYELLHRLGGGGFGEVWLAQKPDAARVALKILHGQHQSGEAVRIRAEIELLAAAASSRSAHIVRVLDGGSQPAPHVVMEYIEGVDLGGEITRRGALPVSEVLKVADAIADALSTLQLLGIIHRDVKPANVMIDTQGVVKLTDFGIAKVVGIDTVTATSQMPMSMAYAAPEVWEGKASHLSDHYAFGALLYHCLAGRPPFGGSYAEIYRHHLMTPPDLSALPPNTPASLSMLIGECLAKDPEQRPQSATALHNAVSAALREMAADQGATVIAVRLQEPKQIGPWVIDSRGDAGEWTFACHHEATAEPALIEVHFADDLEYGQTLRQQVASQPEALIGTSRFLLRPGEGFISAPPSLFLYWLAKKPAAETPPAPAVPVELAAPAGADETQLAPAAAQLTQVLPEASEVTQIARAATPREEPVSSHRAASIAETPIAPAARAALTNKRSGQDLISSVFLLYPLAGIGDILFRGVFYLSVFAGLIQLKSAFGARGLSGSEAVLQSLVIVVVPVVFFWALARFGPASSPENARANYFSLLHWPTSAGGRLGHVMGCLLFAAYVFFLIALGSSGPLHGSGRRALAVFAIMVVIPLVATAWQLMTSQTKQGTEP